MESGLVVRASLEEGRRCLWGVGVRWAGVTNGLPCVRRGDRPQYWNSPVARRHSSTAH